ncbi:MATE family efflux transporter [Crocinitomix algicola]|uniref:hypothetical protein n=1 Tax=Crocinitomix algicola TaxID=1740263 RepID=UPI00082B3349|nr:hypothetical protein [Crocinitomix algicola]
MKNKIIAFSRQYNNQLKGVVGLITIFMVLKSVAYFAPLILSQIATTFVYGEFEYSLNIGLILISVFSFGLPGSFAYFVMKHKRDELIPVFHWHFVILSVLITLPVIFFPSLLSNNWYGALVIGVALADQALVSAILKSSGKNAFSVVIDTGIYLVLGALITLDLLNILAFSKELWFLTILIVFNIFVAFTHYSKLNGISKVSKKAIRELYGFGFLILLSGPLIMLVTNSTRIYLEQFLGLESVSIYSFYFRVATLLLIIYRVSYILLFRKIFLEEHKKLDLWITIIMIMIGVSGVVLTLLFYFDILGYFFNIDNIYKSNFHLLPLVVFQTFFWINSAFLEGLIVRERLLRKFVLVIFSFLTLLVSYLYVYSQYYVLTIQHIIIANTLIIFGMVLGQYFILAQKKIYYRKSLVLNISIALVYLVYLNFTF